MSGDRSARTGGRGSRSSPVAKERTRPPESARFQSDGTPSPSTVSIRSPFDRQITGPRALENGIDEVGSSLKASSAQAGDKKGDERKAFMSDCLKAGAPADPMTQQDKMKVRNTGVAPPGTRVLA